MLYFSSQKYNGETLGRDKDLMTINEFLKEFDDVNSNTNNNIKKYLFFFFFISNSFFLKLFLYIFLEMFIFQLIN